MERKKNIFTTKESEVNAVSAVQTNRIKMGEVFQLENNQYALVCIRCSEEFEYFTEFTIHAQEHLQTIISTPPKESLVLPKSNEMDTHTLELHTDITIENEIKVEPISMDQDMDEYHSNGDEFNDNIVDSDYHWDADNFNGNFIDSDSCDDLGTRLPDAAGTGKKSEENDKKPITQLNKKCDDTKYDQLLKAFRPTALNESNQRAFDALKDDVKSSIVPSDVNDTVAIRMLAMYVQEGYKYKEKDGKLLCPICDNDNGFKNSEAVRRHILTHSQEAVFGCGKCCASFRAPQYLRSHFNRDHVNNLSTFECVYCHQQFKYHRQLMSHINVHASGELECIPCNKKFQFLSVYRFHMRKTHNVTDEAYNERKHIQKRQLCFLCGVTFSNQNSLSRHLKLHNDTKSYICSVCGKAFKVGRYLVRHQRKEHIVSTGEQ